MSYSREALRRIWEQIDTVFTTPEEILFHDVLRDLKNTNKIFLKNWNTFARMKPQNRRQWIEHVKSTASTVPFSEHVLSEVVKRRLKQ